MSVPRNAPCPCGSGKKYKKCCLAKDETAAREKAQAEARAAETARQAEAAAQLARQEEADRQWKEQRQADLVLDDEEGAAESAEMPLDPEWPPLAAEDQQLVNDWWAAVEPLYADKDTQAQCGQLLERTLAFLDQHPRLFRYLYLQEEFLFQLEADLAVAGRTEDYLALLRRLRREQPEMYFEVFGDFDRQLITEALRTGRHEEISTWLDLFRQHPVKEIDELAKVVDLLAWCGCETELRTLLTDTAQTIAASPEVLGGDFGLYWLTHLAIIPFLEAGNTAPETIAQASRTGAAVGYTEDSVKTQNWLLRAVTLSSRSAAEARLDLKQSNERLHGDTAWNFTGWLRRTKGCNWTRARFLADSMLGYWAWNDGQKKRRPSPFGLSESRLDDYLGQRCRDFMGLNGIRVLSTLQAFHYFTEYLLAHDYFSPADASRLQSAATRFYETVHSVAAPSDPAFRLYPTYDALVNGPTPPPVSSMESGVVPGPTPTPQ